MFREPKYFIMCSRHACSFLQRQIRSLSSKDVHYTNSPEQRAESTAFTKHAETQKIHGKLSLNTDSSNMWPAGLCGRNGRASYRGLGLLKSPVLLWALPKLAAFHVTWSANWDNTQTFRIYFFYDTQNYEVFFPEVEIKEVHFGKYVPICPGLLDS